MDAFNALPINYHWLREPYFDWLQDHKFQREDFLVEQPSNPPRRTRAYQKNSSKLEISVQSLPAPPLAGRVQSAPVKPTAQKARIKPPTSVMPTNSSSSADRTQMPPPALPKPGGRANQRSRSLTMTPKSADVYRSSSAHAFLPHPSSISHNNSTGSLHGKKALSSRDAPDPCDNTTGAIALDVEADTAPSSLGRVTRSRAKVATGSTHPPGSLKVPDPTGVSNESSAKVVAAFPSESSHQVRPANIKDLLFYPSSLPAHRIKAADAQSESPPSLPFFIAVDPPGFVRVPPPPHLVSAFEPLVAIACSAFVMHN